MDGLKVQFPMMWMTFLRFSNVAPSDLRRTPEAYFRLLGGAAPTMPVSWSNNGARNRLESPTTDSTYDFDRDLSIDGPWTFLYCCQISEWSYFLQKTPCSAVKLILQL